MSFACTIKTQNRPGPQPGWGWGGVLRPPPQPTGVHFIPKIGKVFFRAERKNIEYAVELDCRSHAGVRDMVGFFSIVILVKLPQVHFF